VIVLVAVVDVILDCYRLFDTKIDACDVGETLVCEVLEKFKI